MWNALKVVTVVSVLGLAAVKAYERATRPSLTERVRRVIDTLNLDTAKSMAITLPYALKSVVSYGVEVDSLETASIEGIEHVMCQNALKPVRLALLEVCHGGFLDGALGTSDRAKQKELVKDDRIYRLALGVCDPKKLTLAYTTYYILLGMLR